MAMQQTMEEKIASLEHRLGIADERNAELVDELADATHNLMSAENALAECRETLSQVLGQIENTLKATE